MTQSHSKERIVGWRGDKTGDHEETILSVSKRFKMFGYTVKLRRVNHSILLTLKMIQDELRSFKKL